MDYPYGYQEVPNDTLAAAIVSAGFAYYDMPVQPQATRLAPHLADHNALSIRLSSVSRHGQRIRDFAGHLWSPTAPHRAQRNVVTITATGPGITTGSTYVGFRFYYPGSASLTAGFYDSILTIPDANTITFSATGANFTAASLSIRRSNRTTATDMISTTIAGNTLKDQSILSQGFDFWGQRGPTKRSRWFWWKRAHCACADNVPGIDTKYSMRCIGTAKQVSMATVGESDQSGTSYSHGSKRHYRRSDGGDSWNVFRCVVLYCSVERSYWRSFHYRSIFFHAPIFFGGDAVGGKPRGFGLPTKTASRHRCRHRARHCRTEPLD